MKGGVANRGCLRLHGGERSFDKKPESGTLPALGAVGKVIRYVGRKLGLFLVVQLMSEGGIGTTSLLSFYEEQPTADAVQSHGSNSPVIDNTSPVRYVRMSGTA